MKKRFFILAFCPSILIAGGPKSTFPTPPGLNDEVVNLYHDLANPVINYATISSETVTTSKITTATISTATISNLRGITDGSSACAGCVGEFISATAGLTSAPTSNQYGDLVSIVLTAGDWDVSSFTYWSINGATWSEADMGISTTSGNNGAGLSNGVNFTGIAFANSATTPTNLSEAVTRIQANVTTTTTYYLKYIATYSAGGPPKAAGSLTARRTR